MRRRSTFDRPFEDCRLARDREHGTWCDALNALRCALYCLICVQPSAASRHHKKKNGERCATAMARTSHEIYCLYSIYPRYPDVKIVTRRAKLRVHCKAVHA